MELKKLFQQSYVDAQGLLKFQSLGVDLRNDNENLQKDSKLSLGERNQSMIHTIQIKSVLYANSANESQPISQNIRYKKETSSDEII